MATSKRDREANLLKRRKWARNRFRNLIRSVALNRIWLMDMGEQKISLNVKKNIALMVRPPRKIGLLTLAEKALIRTNNIFRSVEDRKKLVTLISGMTCFSRIPPKVRARLVPVIKFMVMGPGRLIIKEGDEPSTIYFVLTGEVEITKRTWDRILNVYVDKVDFICGPGDCFGDIELLEDCPRKNSFTSATDVEVLVVFNDDFDRILRPVMSKQWLEKKRALMALHYFDFLSEDQIITACKLGLVRQFEPLESIYFEDKGHVSYVHFVISGECMILQCLKMKVTYRKGSKSFEMVDIGADDEDSLFQDLDNKNLLKKLKEDEIKENRSAYNLISQINTPSDDDEQTGQKAPVRKMDIKTIEIACGLRKPSEEKLASHQASVYSEVDDNIKRSINGDIEEVELTELGENHRASEHFENGANMENVEIAEFEIVEQEAPEMEKKNSLGSIGHRKSDLIITKSEMELSKHTLHPAGNIDDGDDATSFKPKQHSMISTNEGFYKSQSQVTILSKNDVYTRIENHFIDVGSMNFGSIFGIGEKLEHRVIMARTTVQCLMLPRFWLLEKEQNPGNIWQRRRFYLDSTIPSRETLFKDFLTTRKWQKFKNDLIQNNINPNTIGNPTKVQDIPVICRIVEANDD